MKTRVITTTSKIFWRFPNFGDLGTQLFSLKIARQGLRHGSHARHFVPAWVVDLIGRRLYSKVAIQLLSPRIARQPCLLSHSPTTWSTKSDALSSWSVGSRLVLLLACRPLTAAVKALSSPASTVCRLGLRLLLVYRLRLSLTPFCVQRRQLLLLLPKGLARSSCLCVCQCASTTAEQTPLLAADPACSCDGTTTWSVACRWHLCSSLPRQTPLRLLLPETLPTSTSQATKINH